MYHYFTVALLCVLGAARVSPAQIVGATDIAHCHGAQLVIRQQPDGADVMRVTEVVSLTPTWTNSSRGGTYSPVSVSYASKTACYFALIGTVSNEPYERIEEAVDHIRAGRVSWSDERAAWILPREDGGKLAQPFLVTSNVDESWTTIECHTTDCLVKHLSPKEHASKTVRPFHAQDAAVIGAHLFRVDDDSCVRVMALKRVALSTRVSTYAGRFRRDPVHQFCAVGPIATQRFKTIDEASVAVTKGTLKWSTFESMWDIPGSADSRMYALDPQTPEQPDRADLDASIPPREWLLP